MKCANGYKRSIVLATILIASATMSVAQTPVVVTEPSILIWDANPPEEKIRVYHVFLADTPGGQDLTEAPSVIVHHPTTSADLEGLENGTYYAVVIAINIDAIASEVSAEFGFTLDIQPVLPPPPPSMVANLRVELKP